MVPACNSECSSFKLPMFSSYSDTLQSGNMIPVRVSLGSQNMSAHWFHEVPDMSAYFSNYKMHATDPSGLVLFLLSSISPLDSIYRDSLTVEELIYFSYLLVPYIRSTLQQLNIPRPCQGESKFRASRLIPKNS